MPLRVSRAAWTAIAFGGLIVLYVLATSNRVYVRTLPTAWLQHIFGEDDAGAAKTALRKAYSLVAFALAGFVADKALGPGRRRALRSALVVAAFSAAIEIGQKLHHSREGAASIAIDIACGAAGGWLGAALPHLLAPRNRRSR